MTINDTNTKKYCIPFNTHNNSINNITNITTDTAVIGNFD